EMPVMSTVDLTGMPLARALATLASRAVCGTLTVTSTYRTVQLNLTHGEITGIQSNRPADRLGLHLMKTGEIGIVDLHTALVEQHQQRLAAIASDKPTSRLGDILVDLDVLGTEELEVAVERHIQTVISSLESDVILSIAFSANDRAQTQPLAAR
ncbi:MAG TPA: DUF4388 domain-containing protein, partial [Thermomicrobiales bacterium]|nr:DUF4388 domain-containing protein [Thermomicrobiales bacterium]